MISKELQDAIDAAEDACLGAVTHVGAANYAEREREAKKWVRDAFNNLTEVIKMKPHRQMLVRWRDAVARGVTVLGYEDWKKENSK
jgi:hypothetical protein